uniref:Calmodulin like 4 n=1 Tax=Apteryx owenii TaxID=8824 RepID=A0A8B9PFX8_APTOW
QAKFLSQDQINDRNAELDFSTFLNIMYRQMKQEEPEKEILTALSMIDRQKKGFITAAELRAKLTRLGEKLSEAEALWVMYQQGMSSERFPQPFNWNNSLYSYLHLKTLSELL